MSFQKTLTIFLSILVITRIFFINPLPALYDASEYAQLSQKSFVDAITSGHRPSHPGYMIIFWGIMRIAKTIGIDNPMLVGSFLSSIFTLATVFTLYFLVKRLFTKTLAFQAVFIFILLPIVVVLSTTISIEPVSLFFLIFSFFLILVYLSTKKTTESGSVMNLSSGTGLSPSQGIGRYNGRQSVGLHLEKKNLFLAGSAAFFLGYSIFIHGQIIFYIPAYIGVFLLFKSYQKDIFHVFVIATAGIIFAAFCFLSDYYMVTKLSNETLSQFLGLGQQGMIDWYNFPWGTIRLLRNIIIGSFRDYTVPVISAIFYLLIYYRKKISRYKKAGILFIILPLLLSYSLFTADYPGRRSFPISVIFAVLAAKTFSKRFFFSILIIYLLIVTSPFLVKSSFLYKNSQPVMLWQKIRHNLDPNGLYINSHYSKPNVYYLGETFSINGPGYDQNQLINHIDKKLTDGLPVYLESQAVFDPYLYYAGITLNIFSLGNFGYSDAKSLFTRYQIKLVKVADASKRIYIYQLFFPTDRVSEDGNIANSAYLLVKGKGKPGESILIYSTRLSDRILSQRQDYYDLITWIWVLLSGRHEPVTWTYVDANGDFVVPIKKKNADFLKIKGGERFN